MTDRTILIAATLKGIFLAFVLTVITQTTFGQGILIATLSSTISGTFLLVSVHLTNNRTDQKVKEIVDGQDALKAVVVREGQAEGNDKREDKRETAREKRR